MDQQREDALLFTEGWNKELLRHLEEQPQIDAVELMHRCSEYHYRNMDMDQILDRFIGDLKGFLDFLSKEWGWIITYDENTRVITANENKEFCVCPMISAAGDRKVSSVLCHCSEGFGKRMFGKVIGLEVEAEVTNSILRGDKNCIYRIKY